LTPQGRAGANFANVAHGAITGLLFFLVGALKDRAGTTDLDALTGRTGAALHGTAPRLGALLAFAAVASLGLPGLAGFWGEFPAILSAYSPAAGLENGVYWTYMIIASVGTVLAAGYLLWMLQRVAFGTVKDEWKDHHIHDMEWPEYLAWTPMLALIVALGVYPNLLFGVMDESVKATLSVFGG
jgi:NADH-quinone oxidoreductase subunit M